MQFLSSENGSRKNVAQEKLDHTIFLKSDKFSLRNDFFSAVSHSVINVIKFMSHFYLELIVVSWGRVIMISESAISTFCKPVTNGQNDFILQYVVALGKGSSPPGF